MIFLINIISIISDSRTPEYEEEIEDERKPNKKKKVTHYRYVTNLKMLPCPTVFPV